MALTKVKLDTMVTGNLPDANIPNNITITNAGTATALQNARTINGTSFDGSANITVTSAAGTLTGNTLASGVTASSLTSVGTLSSLTTSGKVGINGAIDSSYAGATIHGTSAIKTTPGDGSELRFKLYTGGAADASILQMFKADGSTIGVNLHSDGESYFKNSSHSVLALEAGTNSSASLRLRNDAQHWDVNCQTTDNFAIYDHTGGGSALIIESGGYNATFAGNLTIPEFIYHSGDTDTFIRFTDNKINFVSGNSTALELGGTVSGNTIRGTSTFAGQINQVGDTGTGAYAATFKNTNSTRAGGILIDTTFNNSSFDEPLLAVRMAGTDIFNVSSNGTSTFAGLIKHKGTSNNDYANTAFETRSGNNSQGLKISHGGGNGKLELFGSNQSRTQFYANQITANVNGLEIKTTDAQTLVFGTNNTTRMTIDSAGRAEFKKLIYRVNTEQQQQTNIMSCFHWDHPGTSNVSFFDFNPVLDLGLRQEGGSFFLKISGWMLDRFFGLITYRNNGGTGDISSGSHSMDTIVNDGFSVSVSRPSGNLIRIQLSGHHNNNHGWDMMAYSAPNVT